MIWSCRIEALREPLDGSVARGASEGNPLLPADRAAAETDQKVTRMPPLMRLPKRSHSIVWLVVVGVGVPRAVSRLPGSE